MARRRSGSSANSCSRNRSASASVGAEDSAAPPDLATYARVRDGELTIAEISEEAIAQHLYTAGMADPDLLIRTAGEMRVSNFLLWQISYAELWVTERCWPDFRPEDLYQAIRDFAVRQRRFGGLPSG